MRRLLNEHLAAGRLTPEEFGERASLATQRRTRGELSALFVDLPAPTPDFEGVAVPVPVAGEHGAGGPGTPRGVGRGPLPKHMKNLAISVVAPCALVGLGGGLVAAALAPVVLVLAVLTVGTLFGGLTLLEHLRAGRMLSSR